MAPTPPPTGANEGADGVANERANEGDDGFADEGANEGTVVIIVGIAVGIIVINVGFCVIAWLVYRRRQKKGSDKISDGAGSSDSADEATRRRNAIQPIRAPDLVVPDKKLSVPPYWSNSSNSDIHGVFNETVSASKQECDAIESLLKSTFLGIPTRDRKDSVPVRLKLVSVRRVENSALWKQYTLGRHQVKQKRVHRCTPIERQFNDAIISEQGMPADGSSLERGINETYLWHGTAPQAGKSIAEEGFRVDYAGTNAGTMYGRGIYLAECSSKADEYSAEDTSAAASGQFCLLLSRVVLGEVLAMTTGGESTYTTIKAAIEGGAYDSVLGNRQVAVGTYREFIVYSADQTYPEYVVTYEREFV